MTKGLHLDYECGKPRFDGVSVRFRLDVNGWCICRADSVMIGVWPCVNAGTCHMPPHCTPADALKLAGEVIRHAG